MKPLRLATAGAAALALLAACMPSRQPAAPAPTARLEALAGATPAPPPASADHHPAAPADVADTSGPPRRGGGAFGIGIRPTGSNATGITP
jgi:hypothetical protein